MPIECSIAFSPFRREEFAALDYAVTGHAFDAHHEIGRLVDEAIYQGDLDGRLAENGFLGHREVPVRVRFESFVKSYFLDLVVMPGVIYELKAVTKLSRGHEGQLLNYLLLTGAGHGKLINFGSKSVETRFVNAPGDGAQRRRFRIDDRRWSGTKSDRERFIEMVADWGTGLAVPLYFDVIVHLSGGESLVTESVPILRGEEESGFQRFHFLSDETPFRITAFPVPQSGYADQLGRLIRLTPFRRHHWINIAPGCITFSTIQI